MSKPKRKPAAPTSTTDATVAASTARQGDLVQRADGSLVRITSERPGGWCGRPVVDGVEGELGPWIPDAEQVVMVRRYEAGMVAGGGAAGVDPVRGAA